MLLETFLIVMITTLFGGGFVILVCVAALWHYFNLELKLDNFKLFCWESLLWLLLAAYGVADFTLTAIKSFMKSLWIAIRWLWESVLWPTLKWLWKVLDQKLLDTLLVGGDWANYALCGSDPDPLGFRMLCFCTSWTGLCLVSALVKYFRAESQWFQELEEYRRQKGFIYGGVSFAPAVCALQLSILAVRADTSKTNIIGLGLCIAGGLNGLVALWRTEGMDSHGRRENS